MPTRVHVPEEYQHNALNYVKRTYAREIVDAAQNLSRATYQYTRLSLREFEGARTRVAQINGCMLCQRWRTREDLKVQMRNLGGDYQQSVATHGAPPDEAFYEAVSDWQTSGLLSDRERLAIHYADGLSLSPQGIAADEAFWARFRTAFSDDEIVDLSYSIAGWMGMGRVAHALGLDGSVCALVPEELLGDAS